MPQKKALAKLKIFQVKTSSEGWNLVLLFWYWSDGRIMVRYFSYSSTGRLAASRAGKLKIVKKAFQMGKIR